MSSVDYKYSAKSLEVKQLEYIKFRRKFERGDTICGISTPNIDSSNKVNKNVTGIIDVVRPSFVVTMIIPYENVVLIDTMFKVANCRIVLTEKSL